MMKQPFIHAQNLSEILNSFNPVLQRKDTESAIKKKLIVLLTELKRFQFRENTSFSILKKIERGDKTKYDTFYSHSKAEAIIKENDIDEVFESIHAICRSNYLKQQLQLNGKTLNLYFKNNLMFASSTNVSIS